MIQKQHLNENNWTGNVSGWSNFTTPYSVNPTLILAKVGQIWYFL
jgi:hypothetical protein